MTPEQLSTLKRTLKHGPRLTRKGRVAFLTQLIQGGKYGQFSVQTYSQDRTNYSGTTYYAAAPNTNTRGIGYSNGY